MLLNRVVMWQAPEILLHMAQRDGAVYGFATEHGVMEVRRARTVDVEQRRAPMDLSGWGGAAKAGYSRRAERCSGARRWHNEEE